MEREICCFLCRCANESRGHPGAKATEASGRTETKATEEQKSSGLKKDRDCHWREARLCFASNPSDGLKRYGVTIGSPFEAGCMMSQVCKQLGMNDDTLIHGSLTASVDLTLFYLPSRMANAAAFVGMTGRARLEAKAESGAQLELVSVQLTVVVAGCTESWCCVTGLVEATQEDCEIGDSHDDE